MAICSRKQINNFGFCRTGCDGQILELGTQWSRNFGPMPSLIVRSPHLTTIRVANHITRSWLVLLFDTARSISPVSRGQIEFGPGRSPIFGPEGFTWVERIVPGYDRYNGGIIGVNYDAMHYISLQLCLQHTDPVATAICTFLDPKPVCAASAVKVTGPNIDCVSVRADRDAADFCVVPGISTRLPVLSAIRCSPKTTACRS